MTELLLRHFIKTEDYGDPAVRAQVGRLAGLVGIAANVLLFLCKGAAGLLAGSVSVMADAVNNLSDAGASIITLLGFHMAQRPADSKHPYGHARYEYISGLVVSFMILLVGVELFKTSLSRIFHPEPPEFTLLTFAILLGSMGLKLWLSRFFGNLSGKIHSTALEATAADSRNDFYSTGAVLLCCLISRAAQVHIDGYVGLIMACMIFWCGIQVAQDTISPLLGKQADPEFIKQLTDLVLLHPKILGVHDVLVHDYGPGQCFSTLHAEMDAREDPLVCHDILDDIESDAMERLGTHLVIHYDPVVTDDPEWNSMHTRIYQIVQRIDPRLTIHDFRILRCKDQDKLAFDLAVPYDFPMTEDQIKLRVYEDLIAQGRSYPVVIHFDSV